MQTIRLTVRETARSIQTQYGGTLCPDWALRRLIDEMDAAGIISIQRAGLYRTIAFEDLPLIVKQLKKLGRLGSEVNA